MGFLATLNLVNPDATIARENLQRYQATGKVDAYYLTELSEDAVPALLPALDYMPASPDREVLVRALWSRLRTMEQTSDWREWQALHWSRSEAFAQLTANKDRLEQEAGPR
jgi:hypothetical protein